MSLLIQSSPKHCANKGFRLKNLLNKKFLYGFSTFISTILFISLTIYLILHPSKPQFYLEDTVIDNLSFSSPRILNSTIQITLISKNLNSRVGVYYEDIRAHAIYRGKQITADSFLPSFYQGHEDTTVLSTSLYGTGMPVAASIGHEVGRDQIAGRMKLSLRMEGRLRWKVGSWVWGKYRFNVDCTAIIGLRASGGLSARGGLSSMQGTQCSTSF